jgi:hypothetical protein
MKSKAMANNTTVAKRRRPSTPYTILTGVAAFLKALSSFR